MNISLLKRARVRLSTTAVCGFPEGAICQTHYSTGIPFLGQGDAASHTRFGKELQKIMAVSAGVRRFGSAALDLAYVAAGRYDGFWERGLKSWILPPASCWCAKLADLCLILPHAIERLIVVMLWPLIHQSMQNY